MGVESKYNIISGVFLDKVATREEVHLFKYLS